MMSYAFKYAYDKKKSFYGQFIGANDQWILAYNQKVQIYCNLAARSSLVRFRVQLHWADQGDEDRAGIDLSKARDSDRSSSSRR